MELFGIIVGAILVAVVIGYFGKRAADKRRAELQAFAQQAGLNFFPERDSSIASRFSHFSSFSQGSNRYGYNTMKGHVDSPHGRLEITAGDFHYQTESRDTKGRRQVHTHYFSYLVIHPPFIMHPRMSMRRETFMDRVTGAIGFDDIDFEHDEFSRKFHVKSDDRKFCYDLLDPRMIEWIMSTEPPNFYTAGGQFLTMWKGTWKVPEFSSNIEWLRTFVSKMPTHMVNRLNQATPPAIPPPPLPT